MRYCYRIKIIQASALGLLEEKVNEWLSQHDGELSYESADIVNITVGYEVGVYFAVIQYEIAEKVCEDMPNNED